MNDLLHTYAIYVIQCCSFVYSKKEFYYMNKFLRSPPPSLYSCIITWLVNILRTVWQISRKDDIPEKLNYVGGSSIPNPYT